MYFREYFDGAGFKKFHMLKWVESGDPTAFTKIRMNLDPVKKVIREYNEKNPKKRITLTLLGLKSIGYAFDQVKAKGTYNFGSFIPTEDVKGSIIVTIGDSNLMNLCVNDIDKLNVRELAAQIKGKIGKIKRR